MPQPYFNPPKMPSVSQSMKNILGMEHMQQRNVLARQRMALDKISLIGKAISAGIQTGDPEAARQIYSATTAGLEDAPQVNFDFLGGQQEMVRIETPSLKATLPRSVAIEYFDDALGNNSQHLLDPESNRQTNQWLMENGATELILTDPETQRIYDVINDRVISGTPQQIERAQLQAPERFRTLKERKEAVKPKKQKWSTPKTGITEEGKRVFFQTTPEGDVRTLGGVQPEPKRGMKIYDREGNLLVDTTGEGMRAKEAEMMREAEISTRNALNLIEDIKGLVGQDPTAIGTIGAAQRTINSLARQVENLYQKGLGIKEKPNLLTKEKYKKELSLIAEGAIVGAQIKSAVLDLAYLIARSREPSSRQLAEGDIQRALDTIGASTGSPEQFLTVLDMVQDRLKDQYAVQYQVRTGTQLPAGFWPEKQGAVEPEAARPQTQEEYDALPSDALFIDPEDGQLYRKP